MTRTTLAPDRGVCHNVYVGFIVLHVFRCALDLVVYDVGEIDVRRSGNTDGTTTPTARLERRESRLGTIAD